MTIEEAMQRVRGIAAAVSCGDTCKASEALRLILGEVERLSGEVTGGRELVAATLYQANVTQGKLSEALIAAEARAKALEDALRFYANDDNWGPTPLGDDIFEVSAIEQDEGNIARAALAPETKSQRP